jgi:hypothetical protein
MSLELIACSVCNKTFGSQKSLHYHQTRVHSLINTQDEPRNLCEYCNSSYHSKDSLRAHLHTCKVKNSPYVIGLQNDVVAFKRNQACIQSIFMDNHRYKQELEEATDKIEDLKQELHDSQQDAKRELEDLKAENQQLRTQIQLERLKGEKMCVEARLEVTKETQDKLLAQSDKITELALNAGGSNKRIKVNTNSNNTNTNNTNNNSTTINNYNLMIQRLKPVTDEFIQSMSVNLVKDPENPVLHTTMQPYVDYFLDKGLNKSIVCLDVSRNKICWINGDENNAEIKDTNGLHLANKLMKASERDFSILAHKAREKCQAIPFDAYAPDAIQAVNERLKYTEALVVANRMKAQHVNNLELVESIGKSLVKSSIGLCPAKALLTNNPTGATGATGVAN